MKIDFDSMIREANTCLKKKQLPNHNAFTISEVIGAVTGVPKEVVLDKMLDMQKK